MKSRLRPQFQINSLSGSNVEATKTLISMPFPSEIFSIVENLKINESITKSGNFVFSCSFKLFSLGKEQEAQIVSTISRLNLD